MAFSWDPALREREREESVTAVPAFSRSLNGALSGEEPWRIGVLLGSHPCASVPATGPGASSPLSALSEGATGVLAEPPSTRLPRVAVSGRPSLGAAPHQLDDAADSLVGALSGSPAAWASFQDDDGLGTAASSSAPAPPPGVELSRLPLWGALPFMAVLDAVRTRP